MQVVFFGSSSHECLLTYYLRTTTVAVSFLCFVSRSRFCWLLIRSNTRGEGILLYPVPGSYESSVIFDVMPVFSTARTSKTCQDESNTCQDESKTW